MLKGLKGLFDLPDDTKMKNSSFVHHGYLGNFEGRPIQTLNSMIKMMQEHEGLARNMIFESLGVKHYYDTYIKYNDYLFRVVKQGIEILYKESQWLQVVRQPKIFVVIAGKTLMAWSNGRIHAPKHRVIVKGKIDRYPY
ncbi:probable 2-oxoglutarate-dependent dioxygenase AOP1 [Papaver somniferum]|uniref:probable 2-oxoglutarate-dependent dioxygenase AOP1 n=1 Tax=Papaver somniferum TaxID=3469 RepID=UPI000E6FB206|nr:probable 2-oxoglutarate-dependent dioxygenase AOP1 [Papaver somniferum]